MSGRGGRGRFRRASRFEDNFGSRNISNKNPPSRHLWVGNLSHATLEHDLSHYFLQFGELESVAFQPGRSYAFINFKREDDAFVAINALQGFPIAGNPLRIEFTKAGVTYVRVCNGLPASDDFAAASKMYLMEIALGTLISKLPAGYMVVRNCCWMLCKLVGNDIEDKPSTPLRDEDYSQHQDEHSASRGSPFSQREFRARHASPDPFYPEKFNTSDKSMEPSSVLWIGFPALLKVDEMILRKAFSPFGEIEKITAFPGRSYAFVRFRSVVSAFRAKEILQGKLFGNPRVHICFAKSETGSSNGARSSMNVPPSPHSKSDIHLGYSGNLWQDRNFGSLSGDLSIRSQFLPDLDTGDSDAHGFNRKRTSWMGGNNACELARFGDGGSDLGPPHDIYEHRDSSTREGRAPLSDYPEDPWDLSEDVNFFHGAKKLKTGPFPPEKDLPEHPFSDLKQDKHRLPKVFSDFPRHEVFNKNFEAVLHVNKQTPDRTNVAVPHGERSDHWGESYDSFQVGSGSLISKPIEKKRFMPESDQSSLNEWKWEGTIAKGGTPVCRARCFPVGKVLDIMLPEFLDCTARTGLDMLSKHYYQAAKAWVVFFVPESDADMGFYNELMHYLGEKQRAAVAKLDEKTTLFLVPPSDFSEKVLKVPGKLSISGVVLRLEHPGSNFGSIHLQNEKKNTNSLPINCDAPYTKPSTASPPIHPLTSFQDLGKLGVPNASFSGNVVNSAPVGSFSGSGHALNGVSDSYNENRHDYQLNQGNPMSGQNFLSHQLQNSMSGPRDVPSQVSNCAVPVVQEHHSFVPNTGQETSSSHYKGGISGISLSGNGKSFLQETHTSAAFSVAALQPDQLAQLASSLLGQQRQSGSTSHISVGDEFRSTNRPNDSENSLRISQKYVLQNNQVSSELSTSQFGQIQQLQQQQQRTSNVSAVSRMVQGVQGNQLLQNSNTQKEAEADPQKRLQATLQLAAALLQQIQQGKGS